MHNMEKRNLGNNKIQKGLALDPNRCNANQYKREVRCHKYICPKSLQGKRAMLGHLKRSTKISARWENNTRRISKFGKKHRRIFFRKISHRPI